MGILRTDKISGLETPTAVTGSVEFDGNGDWITVAESEDFNFGTGDFTVEFWIYWDGFNTGGTRGVQLTAAVTNGIWIGQINSTSYVLRSYGNANHLTVTPPPIEQWHHIAVTRKNSTARFFVNGKLEASGTVTHNFVKHEIVIGSDESTGHTNGYISNVRMLKGTALYTSNFTPPARELEVIGDTVLLCCNNSDSAQAEGTGKTITVNNDAVASTFSPGLTRDFTYGTEFNGVTTFDTQGYFVPPSGTTEQRGGTRGLRMGGNNASNVIEYYDISTIGNTQDFGDLSFTIKANAACSSSTRALSAGGEISGSGNTNHIDFVSIMSTGNAVTFGDLDPNSLDISHTTGLSNSTRGIFSGGYGSPGPFGHCDHMAFVTIAALGNGQDFGDLNYSMTNAGSFSSPTRGVIGGGQNPGFLNTIGFITIATTGSAQDFGDLTVARRTLVGGSNSVRGLFAGGQNTSPNTDANGVDTIDYVTIASTGNAQDFGNLSGKRLLMSAGTSSTRCVWPGGESLGNTANNAMEYVTIASTGDAIDFGDTITSGRFGPGGCSNGHGGIS